MHRFQTALLRFIVPLMVTVALVGAALAFGQTAKTPGTAATAVLVDHHVKVHRYYDRDRKDYHQWTEQEEHAYRDYLKAQRHEYKDFSKMDRKERRDYWHWRHEHPDELR